jgi:hypothetical protein
MNPRNLIRTAAATLAATTFLFAQSALVPAAGGAQAPKTTNISPERLQVRLAEVIAMLEEDDLTPEQRDAAKKKLQEISARLKAASTKEATPPVSRGRSWMLAEPVAPVAPSASVEPMAPLDPLVPPVARAPRAPKPPVEVAEVQDPAPNTVRFARPAEVEVVEVRSAADKLRAEANLLKARAKADNARAEVEAPDSVKARVHDANRSLQKAKAQAEALEQDAKIVRVRRLAEGQAAKAEAEAEAEADAKAKDVRVRRLRNSGGEEAVIVETPKSPMLLQLMNQAEGQAKPKVLSLDDVSNARSVTGFGVANQRRKAPKSDADDDDEVMELLQQMRAEMKEIKKMLQDLKQQQSRNTRTRALGVGSSGGGQWRTYSSFGSGEGKAPATSSGSGGSSGGGKARTFSLFGAGEEAKPKMVRGTFTPTGDFKAVEFEGGDIFVVEEPKGAAIYEWKPGFSGTWKAGTGGFGQEKAVEVIAPKATAGKRFTVRAGGGGGDNELK